MATKPIRIYGVLSKITLAKDEPSTSKPTSEREPSEPKKFVPAVKRTKKLN